MNASTKNWRDLTRGQQVMVYTLCRLETLKWVGVIAGGHIKPAPQAMDAYAEMRAEGFEPTQEETAMALQAIRAHCERTKAAHDAAAAENIIDWREVIAWREGQEVNHD